MAAGTLRWVPGEQHHLPEKVLVLGPALQKADHRTPGFPTQPDIPQLGRARWAAGKTACLDCGYPGRTLQGARPPLGRNFILHCLSSLWLGGSPSSEVPYKPGTCSPKV